MTFLGWIVMTLSIVFVLCLVSFCVFKVLTLPPLVVEEHLHAPPTIDPGDSEDAD